jgi:phage terminase large subunit-like protein
MTKASHPLEFYKHLQWLDGRPLLETIEPYRQKILSDALYTFDEDGRPRYNFVLNGRGKKNWKTADLILAALYRLLVWPSDKGNDCFILANDEGQAADDLTLAKKMIYANPILE